MSLLTQANSKPAIYAAPVLVKFILGFALIYGTLEVLARLLGDTLPTQNALLITGAVLTVTLVVEMGLFTRDWQAALRRLGLGWSGWPALGVALLIALLQLAVYPLITWLTGYRWTLPPNWLWTMVGIFALHGVAEEVLYRAFLFGHLRQGRSFWRAAWLAVLLFTLSHLPILATQGLLVGGAAVMLSIASSFAFARLYEQGRNTIWAPALVHGAVDTVIPLLAVGGMAGAGQQAALIWMGLAMVLPYLAFLFPKSRSI
ncbi:MAG: CPBP family intramembrane glutamic endopeptidase [Caldilineaceae bacterium]